MSKSREENEFNNRLDTIVGKSNTIDQRTSAGKRFKSHVAPFNLYSL